MTERPRTSTRDVAETIHRLAAWLGARVGAEQPPVISNLRGPDSAGFSSETLLLDAEWVAAGASRRESYVLRLPPPTNAFPLFPRYEMNRQATAMRFVRGHSAVPVPHVLWYESDESVLGASFYVMEHVDGLVVPDVPPYVFGSWVTDGDEKQQARMRAGMVDLLVGIGGITASRENLAPWELDTPGATALARHVANQRRYYEWIRGGAAFPLIDATFAWLEEHWPSNADDAVLSWGDARIANVLYLVYAELRQALTSIRVSSRAVHFGERPPPDDPQDLILERDHLRAVVAGDIAV
jgi:aminoglycoside phosphotransferase (APT) family kinase protein